MKYTLIAIVVLSIISACEDNSMAGEFVDYSVKISYRDSNNVNLLDPENEGSYKEEDIKLYYVIEGEVEYVYLENSDLHKQFMLICNDSCYLEIEANSYVTSDTAVTVTYLELSPDDTDTIQCELNIGKGYRYVTKVWYNGVLTYDSLGNYEPYVKVIK